MTTALFTLRCLQVGLRLDDIDQLDAGAIYDIFTEHQNDDYNYPVKPTQDDFDNFARNW